jgi:hypothetical protein
MVGRSSCLNIDLVLVIYIYALIFVDIYFLAKLNSYGFPCFRNL